MIIKLKENGKFIQVMKQLIIKLKENGKGRVTDMRYFAGSKFSMTLVHKKNFSLIWQVVFKLGAVFCKRGRIPLLSLNELWEKSQATIILAKL